MGLPESCNIDLHSKFKKGPMNLITDVKGVMVGHKTVKGPDHKNTGVTVVLPHDGDVFHDKVMAATSVINGFGKSVGLVQINELGTIESPIVMTNTLSVGTCLDACDKYLLEKNPDIGVKTGSVNVVVTECNDADTNNLRGQYVTKEDFDDAINACGTTFEEGCVGAGTGMVCFGFKGGIGSASRVLEIDGKEYTVGALVLSNFGIAGNLRIGGEYFEQFVPDGVDDKRLHEKGSIIMLIATDAPANDRQLRRMANRAAYSLGKLGSFGGNGSGDIAIAFSTGNRVPHYSDKTILETKMLFDDETDGIFRCGVEAVEEAIVSALYHATTTPGREEGKTFHAFREVTGK